MLGSLLCPVLIKIFITDLNDGAECILGKFADSTKQGGAADTPIILPPPPRDLDRLGK